LWSGDIYTKSFKHLATNALRLRLAPNRFRQGQAKRGKQKSVSADRNEGKKSSGEMPRSQWSYLVSERLDELASICRRGDLSNEKTHSRVQGIMYSLRRLKTLEPKEPEERSFIPKLPIRQAMALAKASEAERQQHDQQDQQLQEFEQDLYQHLRQPAGTQNHLHDIGSVAVASDDNDGGADRMLLDAELHDIESIDDADDDDREWAPDEEYGDLADEFDSQYRPPEHEVGQVNKDSELPRQESTVESSGKQFHRLFTVVKILVHSPHITGLVSNKDVQGALLTNMDATNKELSAVRDIVNWLRPFAPKRVQTETGYRDHTGHVVLCAPMVLIAQAFFDVVGLHKFKRRICPQVDVGSTMSLILSSTVLYELFGTSGEGQFDIQGPTGRTITAAADAANPSNKEAVVAAFFNLEKVQAICNDHNLVFDNRLIFQDRLSLRLQGTLIPHGPQREGYPVESAFDRRTEKNRGRNASSWIWSQELQHWNSLSRRQIEKAANDSALIAKTKAADLKASKSTQRDPTIVNKQERELAQSKREAYYWAKVEKASKSSQNRGVKAPTPVAVTWTNHHVEEGPARIQLKSLVDEVETNPAKIISWAGGDPGVRVMLEVVPSSTQEIKAHLSRFHALYGKANLQAVIQSAAIKSVFANERCCTFQI
jgi:hypothetical protein